MSDDIKLIEKIYEKQEAMSSDISQINTTLVYQAEQLKHHILRTEIAEKNIELLRDDFRPVQKHVHYVEGAFKLIGALALLVTIIGGVIKIFSSIL